MCVLGVFGGRERVSDPLDLELELVLIHSVNARIENEDSARAAMTPNHGAMSPALTKSFQKFIP